MQETVATFPGEHGVDILRYLLCRESNISLDCDWSTAGMTARLNAELADALGNLVCRCTSQNLNPSHTAPQPGPRSAEDEALITCVDDLAGWVDHHLLRFDTQRALDGILEALGQINRYVTASKPWALLKSDPARYGSVLYLMVDALRVVATLLLPFMPRAAASILDQLGVPSELRTVAHCRFGVLPGGHPLGPEVPILFPKLGAVWGKKNPKGNKKKAN